jgi:hypothetical protein
MLIPLIVEPFYVLQQDSLPTTIRNVGSTVDLTLNMYNLER